MIEQQVIGGRQAFVAYLTDKFEPADKESATLVKVIFEDGSRIFLVPEED